MSRYDGLIIPRSYSEYINKTDAATLQQALQLPGVLSGAVADGDNKPLTSDAVYGALTNYINKTDAATLQQALQLPGVMDNAPTAQSINPAKSGGIFAANAVIMASSTTLSGVAISAGSVVRVLFTADLTGSDATTGLTLTYNGNAYAVKVGKNGALAAFVASEISSGVFKYLQAYTTLELIFDGTQFIIIGNPVVLSSANYTIYADGRIRQFGIVEIHLSLGETMAIATFKGSVLQSINAMRMHSEPSTAIYNFGYSTKILTIGYMAMGSSSDYATEGFVYYEMIGMM